MKHDVHVQTTKELTPGLGEPSGEDSDKTSHQQLNKPSNLFDSCFQDDEFTVQLILSRVYQTRLTTTEERIHIR